MCAARAQCCCRRFWLRLAVDVIDNKFDYAQSNDHIFDFFFSMLASARILRNRLKLRRLSLEPRRFGNSIPGHTTLARAPPSCKTRNLAEVILNHRDICTSRRLSEAQAAAAEAGLHSADMSLRCSLAATVSVPWHAGPGLGRRPGR